MKILKDYEKCRAVSANGQGGLGALVYSTPGAGVWSKVGKAADRSREGFGSPITITNAMVRDSVLALNRR